MLALSVAARDFQRNGRPNRTAQHDVGLAAALPQGLLELEAAPRSRQGLAEIVFGAAWGEEAGFLAS